MLFLEGLGRPRIARKPDGGGGGGTPPASPAAPAAPAGGAAPTGNEPGDADPEHGTVTFSPEQQKAIDGLVGERLKRARSKWDEEQAEATRKAQAEAEQKRLKEQAEWQKLAEQHEAKVAELAPQVKSLSEELAGYRALVDELLAARVKALGEKAQSAVDALPGEPDALAKLRWLNANESLFAGTPGDGLGTPPRKVKPAPKEPAGGQDSPGRPLIRF